MLIAHQVLESDTSVSYCYSGYSFLARQLLSTPVCKDHVVLVPIAYCILVEHVEWSVFIHKLYCILLYIYPHFITIKRNFKFYTYT